MRDFFIKLKQKIVDLFHKLTKAAKVVIPIGIEIVDQIKKITDSKYADIIVALTPTTVDDSTLKAIRTILPKVLKELDEWNAAVQGTDEEIIKASLLQINSYPAAKKNLLYLGIASIINSELANGAMTPGESIIATQSAYDNPELLNS